MFGLPWNLAAWNGATTYAVLQIVGEILGILHIPSVLLRRSERPLAQLTWILALLSVPYVGVLLWWAIGRTHLERKRRKRADARERMSESLANVSRADDDVEWPTERDDLPREAIVIGAEEASPATRNRVRILHTGLEAYPAFEAAIRSATHHIHVEFYIWQRDEVGRRIRDLLIEKAREGVEVRVLYDAFGASALTSGGFMRQLEEAGGRVASFLPFRLERSLRVNFRNHRKLLIVDGRVGFTGGLNIGQEYNEWYDVAFGVEGPAVGQLQEVFAEDWFFAAHEDLGEEPYFPAEEQDPPAGPGPGHTYDNALVRVLPSGPDNWRNLTHAAFFLAITGARERIEIVTPYFIPDQAIMMALRTAAMRGVDVRLLLPGRSDVPIARTAGRGYFDELLEAGVRIFEYQPHVLHAKLMMVDREWAIVGSANVDNRSFRLQFEVNLVIESRQVNHALHEDFERHLAESEEIEPDAWAQRSTWSQLKEAMARLLSPVL